MRHRELLFAEVGDLESLLDHYNNEETLHEAYTVAAQHGHLHILTHARMRNVPKKVMNKAIQVAAEAAQDEVVTYLLGKLGLGSKWFSSLRLRVLPPGIEPALMSAAQQGHVNVLRAMVAVADAYPKIWQAALGSAFDKQQWNSVKFMVTQATPDEDTTSFVLGKAAAHGSLELVQDLLELLEKTEISVHVASQALIEAARHGHVDVVDFFIQPGANIGSAATHQALRLAAEGGHMQMVDLLLQRGADPTTLLGIPAGKGDLEGVQLFLEYLDPRKTDVQPPVLEAAAQSGNLEVLKLLVWRVVRPKTRVDVEAMLVAAARHADVVAWILQNFAFSNRLLEHALLEAAHHGQLDTVMVLHQAGVNLRAQNSLAVTLAMKSPTPDDLVLYLLDHGGAADSRLSEALGIALTRNLPAMVDSLLQRGVTCTPSMLLGAMETLTSQVMDVVMQHDDRETWKKVLLPNVQGIVKAKNGELFSVVCPHLSTEQLEDALELAKAEEGDEEIIRHVLNRLDVHSVDFPDFIFSRGDYVLVKVLVEKGVQLPPESTDFNAWWSDDVLTCAVDNNDTHELRALLPTIYNITKANVEYNGMWDHKFVDLLRTAVKNRNQSMVELLLDNVQTLADIYESVDDIHAEMLEYAVENHYLGEASFFLNRLGAGGGEFYYRELLGKVIGVPGFEEMEREIFRRLREFPEWEYGVDILLLLAVKRGSLSSTQMLLQVIDNGNGDHGGDEDDHDEDEDGDGDEEDDDDGDDHGDGDEEDDDDGDDGDDDEEDEDDDYNIGDEDDDYNIGEDDDYNIDNAVTMAIQTQRLDIVRYLLQRGGNLMPYLKHKSVHVQTKVVTQLIDEMPEVVMDWFVKRKVFVEMNMQGVEEYNAILVRFLRRGIDFSRILNLVKTEKAQVDLVRGILQTDAAAVLQWYRARQREVLPYAPDDEEVPTRRFLPAAVDLLIFEYLQAREEKLTRLGLPFDLQNRVEQYGYLSGRWTGTT